MCIWDAFAQSLGLILFHAAYALWVTWSELQFVRAPNDLSSRIRPSECIDEKAWEALDSQTRFFKRELIKINSDFIGLKTPGCIKA